MSSETTHVVPKKIYVAVFSVLMILTVITVRIAFQDFGPWNTILALAIAVTKATLVILYFMHVRYSDRLTWVVVCGGFLWLAVLLVLTMSDYTARDWLPIYNLTD
jgi:cytochrome c oxidase subunit 4